MVTSIQKLGAKQMAVIGIAVSLLAAMAQEIHAQKAGADINALIEEANNDPINQMMNAAKDGDMVRLADGISSGVGIDCTNKFGQTQLMYASAGGHTNTAGLLLQNKASLAAKDQLGRTPLMFAAEGNQAGMVRFLIEAGAVVDETDALGYTALIHAAKAGGAQAAQALIDNKASIDIQDGNGITPLIGAVVNRHKDTAFVLVQSGARLDIQSKSGFTAEEYARAIKATNIVNLLQGKVAK